MKKFIFICILFNFIFFYSKSESPLKVALSEQISYLGWGTTLTLAFEKNNYEIYLGPKLAHRISYLTYKMPVGISTGFICYIPSSNKFQGFANVSYQLMITEPYCPNDDCTERNFIHEYTGGFGVKYSMTNKWAIAGNINAGRYTKALYNVALSKIYIISGFNNLLSLNVSYNL